MTRIEFYDAVINGNINEEVIDQATAYKEKVIAANAKRAATPSKTAQENSARVDEVITAINDGAISAAEIGVAIGVSTSKASAIARQGVSEGRIESFDHKVKGKGKVKGYRVVEAQPF